MSIRTNQKFSYVTWNRPVCLQFSPSDGVLNFFLWLSQANKTQMVFFEWIYFALFSNSVIGQKCQMTFRALVGVMSLVSAFEAPIKRKKNTFENILFSTTKAEIIRNFLQRTWRRFWRQRGTTIRFCVLIWIILVRAMLEVPQRSISRFLNS